jgi:SAM-dependent methyltransferase
VNAHGLLFDRIAGAYQWFFKAQVKYYAKAIDCIPFALPIPVKARVLDVGCGTGALAKHFQERGYDVTGIDVATRMVSMARRNGIDCAVGDILSGLPFQDHEFDLVTCAFFIHGIAAAEREKAFKEAGRLSKFGVLIIDYNVRESHAPWYVRLAEFFEGGDYRGFLRTGLAELQSSFRRVDVHEASKTTAFYLCSAPK